MNMTPENRAHFESEKEAIHLILTGIGDEIYSTVDACQTAQEIDPEQAQRDKDMQKNLALIAKYFKKIYKPTNNNLRTSSNTKNKNVDTTLRYKNDNQTRQFGNQRAVNVVGARETVGGQVVQQSGIQCFNCKEFGHYAKECRKPKWVKDSTYHKEKMLLYTDEEIDEQELEAHYSYMAKIQEVPNADSGTDAEPLEQWKRVSLKIVDYDKLERKLNETLGLLAQKEIDIKEGLKVKAYEISVVKEKHDELVKQSLLTKSHYEGLVKEKTKVITDLKLKEEKDIDKMISMENQLKFLNEIVYKRSQSIQTIHMLAPKCPTFNGRPTFANPMYLKRLNMRNHVCMRFHMTNLILQTDSSPIGRDSLTLDNEVDHNLNKDYYESLEDEIDELESDKAKFSNMYDMLLQECVSNDIMCSYLQSSSDLDEITELQCLYLHKVRECDFLAQKLSEYQQNFIPKPSVLGKSALFSNSLERINFSKKKSISKTNESKGLSKPVTPHNLPQTATQAVRNTNVIKSCMYQIASSTTQTRAPQLTQTSRITNPRVSTSTGVAYRTNVSRPQPRSNQMKDKVLPNTSQVKFKKTKVEDHPRISRISNQTKSVTACNDSLNSRTSNVNTICATCGKCVFNSNHDACVSKFLNDVNARTKKPNGVPISTGKPKSQANKSDATPYNKTVASESTITNSKSCYRMLYKKINKACKWWIT
ncbi:retrovirus-related pol polyprotein from transposon TNT 1-94 [Tanacetum coccineum]